MKTPEEWADNLISNQIKIIKEIQNESYNQALEDADKLLYNMNASELTVVVRIRIEKLKK